MLREEFRESMTLALESTVRELPVNPSAVSPQMLQDFLDHAELVVQDEVRPLEDEIIVLNREIELLRARLQNADMEKREAERRAESRGAHLGLKAALSDTIEKLKDPKQSKKSKKDVAIELEKVVQETETPE